MKHVIFAALALALGLGLVTPAAQALDGPAGQVFRAVATRSTDLAQEGDTATIRFEAGGQVTVSGIRDAMGSDPFTTDWHEEANGEIYNGLDIFWMDPYGEPPVCSRWPDIPVGANIQDVGGDWDATGVCWLGPAGGWMNWSITRIE